ncbi:hypothetical protein HDU93_002590 [Gonapodya sp. JEL0774]|nr:hypothetical protein HDU93_002590 [Gonapodya sp. JEL0774]
MDQLDYHTLLHALSSYSLVDEPEQVLFQMLDAFSHSNGLPLFTQSSRRPSVATSDVTKVSPELLKRNSSQIELETSGQQEGNGNVSNGDTRLFVEIERREVADITFKQRNSVVSKTKRRSTLGATHVVVLSDKISSEKSGDEKCVIPHQDIVRIFEVLAHLRMSKYKILNEKFGKHPKNPAINQGANSKSLQINHRPSISESRVTSSVAEGTCDPSARVIAIVDQIFRYTGNCQVSSTGSLSTIKGSDTIQLKHLREWVAMQAQYLPNGLSTFLKDTCMTLFAVPDELLPPGSEIEESFGPNTSATQVAVATGIFSEPVLPVLWCTETYPKILNPLVAWQLSSFLPESAAKKTFRYSSGALQAVWKLIYSGNHHGFSLQMFRDHVFKCGTPTLMLIRCKADKALTVGTVASENFTIGAYVPTNWEESKTGFFGSEECFIFELQPYFEVIRVIFTQFFDYRQFISSFGV